MVIYPWEKFKKNFWLAAGFFGTGLGLGILVGKFSPETAGRFMRILSVSFAPLTRELKGEAASYAAMVIFVHNLRAAVLLLVLGVTLVYPCLSLFINGFIVGLVAIFLRHSTRVGVGQLLLFFLPHGLFELPAFFLAAAFGWHWAGRFWRYLRGREVPGVFRTLFPEMVRTLAVIIALLAVAAWSETYISAAFIRRFLRFNPLG